jgi:thioredoxin 1
MSAIIDVTGENFDAEVIQNDGLALVDFWAPWCGPCKMQTPILEKLSQDDSVKVSIYKSNTDEDPSVAQKYGISSIPTLILFRNGEEIERFVGVQPENVLKDKISQT